MREFESLNTMWMCALNDTWSAPKVSSRNGPCREVPGYAAVLLDPTNNFVLNTARKADPVYAAAELLWYLSASRTGDMIRAYAPQYENFLDEGLAWGAYGYRIKNDIGFKDEFRLKSLEDWGASQFTAVHKLLCDKPDSRHAIMSLWNGGDLVHAVLGDRRDLPCTMNLHFALRQEKLDLHVHMRSNDVWLGMPYDVWCFTCLQMLMAEMLDCKVGKYFHVADSMHLYERNECSFETALDSDASLPDLKHRWVHRIPIVSFKTSVEYALTIEQIAREGRSLSAVGPSLEGTLIGDLAALCAWKWDLRDLDITSSILKRAVEIKYADN